jgi:hypothetical protein
MCILQCTEPAVVTGFRTHSPFASSCGAAKDRSVLLTERESRLPSPRTFRGSAVASPCIISVSSATKVPGFLCGPGSLFHGSSSRDSTFRDDVNFVCAAARRSSSFDAAPREGACSRKSLRRRRSNRGLRIPVVSRVSCSSRPRYPHQRPQPAGARNQGPLCTSALLTV